ncbi:MAG: hypothetical protein JKY88_17665 [Pseudomonadales bacterium]|nr:hypothetical protein [Pseudomonadales bacterium]
MSKPIEAGCRACLVNAGNSDGEIVNVTYFVGVIYGQVMDVIGHYRAWNIIEGLPDPSGKIIHVVAECQLQRIDDYDGNDVISWEEMKGIFQPERVTA